MLCVYLGFIVGAQLPQESPIRTRNLPSRRGLSPVKRGEIRLCAVTVFRAQVHVPFSVRTGVSLRHDLLQERGQLFWPLLESGTTDEWMNVGAAPERRR